MPKSVIKGFSMAKRVPLIALCLLCSLLNSQVQGALEELDRLIFPLVTEGEIISWEEWNSFPVEKI
ncbi:MAG: hypothetical protein ACK4OO_06440, partial [bacterium]